MDAFQAREARRLLIQREAIGVWVEFRTSVHSLVDSYNGTEGGRTAPATVKPESNERALIVQQNLGLAADKLHTATVTITIRFDEGRFVIRAVVEEWLTLHHNAPVRSKLTTMEFAIEADAGTDRVWLSTGEGALLTPFAAAEMLLVKFLVANF